jgi:hypothetical protein
MQAETPPIDPKLRKIKNWIAQLFRDINTLLFRGKDMDKFWEKMHQGKTTREQLGDNLWSHDHPFEQREMGKIWGGGEEKTRQTTIQRNITQPKHRPGMIFLDTVPEHCEKS